MELMEMGARMYSPRLGRWLSPDTIIPDPTNPQSLNRYSYVYNNPVVHRDGSGHCIDGISTWACLAAGAALILKAIDYGWTAYDAYQDAKTLADPNADRAAKTMAGLNVAMAVIFEAAEPDELLPAGLPLDDVARKAVMKGAHEAFEEGGEAGLEQYIRDNLGEHADDVLQHIGLGQPRKLTPTDLGIKGNITDFNASMSIVDGKATIRVDMIAGAIENPLEVFQNAQTLARSNGANVLRIEASLVNEQLYDILTKRYGFVTEGSDEFLEIVLK